MACNGIQPILVCNECICEELTPRVAIEKELATAIFKTGGILESNFVTGNLTRVNWTRSSRTDKGVS